jgi:hypothetical protein
MPSSTRAARATPAIEAVRDPQTARLPVLLGCLTKRARKPARRIGRPRRHAGFAPRVPERTGTNAPLLANLVARNPAEPILGGGAR